MLRNILFLHETIKEKVHQIMLQTVSQIHYTTPFFGAPIFFLSFSTILCILFHFYKDKYFSD